MTGYRTTLFAALLILFGALQAALPDLQKAISPTWYPYIFMAVGLIVHLLRSVTSTPIFAKEGEPAKNVHNLVAAAAMSIVALVGALFPAPAPAATEHDNGSITLTRDEAMAVNAVLDQLDTVVKKQGAILREQQRQIEAFQKGKCL